jgi:hypothetical protein
MNMGLWLRRFLRLVILREKVSAPLIQSAGVLDLESSWIPRLVISTEWTQGEPRNERKAV